MWINESDEMYGISNIHALPAAVVASTSPIVCADNGNTHITTGPYYFFGDCTNYAKQAWLSYLQAKYGTVAAMNTAWGFNCISFCYTQFTSTGTPVVGESFGTGDGSTLTFTHTLSNSNVAPNSIQVLVGVVTVAADSTNVDEMLGPTSRLHLRR